MECRDAGRGEVGADSPRWLVKSIDYKSATEIWEVDEPILLAAARLKARFRISLADALIAAFAKRSSAILVHKDPEYEALADQVRQEALPYK